MLLKNWPQSRAASRGIYSFFFIFFQRDLLLDFFFFVSCFFLYCTRDFTWFGGNTVKLLFMIPQQSINCRVIIFHYVFVFKNKSVTLFFILLQLDILCFILCCAMWIVFWINSSVNFFKSFLFEIFLKLFFSFFTFVKILFQFFLKTIFCILKQTWICSRF